jgi:hypothetical protein
MKSRGYLFYALFVVIACVAVGAVVWQVRSGRDAEDARKNPEPQVVRIPAPTPSPDGPRLPPGGGPLPPGLQPLPPGAGPMRGTPGPVPFRADGTARPPFMGGVKQEAVIDLNSAPVSALVTLPGITPDYAKLIVAHRPYRDRPDLETKTGLPHSVVEQLGPPAMIRSTSIEPMPTGAVKKR